MRIVFFCILFATPVFGKELMVSDDAGLTKAISSAEPGDHLVLREGEWRDVKIVFVGQGTPSAPITLRAEKAGKTILTGSSTLHIGGEYLVVEGLAFRNPDPSTRDLIQFRKDSKQLAQHCRMTNCAVTSTLPSDRSQESRWVGLFGSNHRVDHCQFEGKSGKGATFVVWLGDRNGGQHQIDHNYFGPREPLGENGGETIRIGDSKTSLLDGNCLVEKNYFERCNGEAECISNKSCGNIYRENCFVEVSGTLTLRHGNRCTVQRNVFLGNDARGTGGIRIIGEDHVVCGNYLERLTGSDARAAICLMMGIPNSPAHRYFQVQRATIEFNTIVQCKHPIVIGLRDDKDATLAPVETVFRSNQALCPNALIIDARCDLDGIEWVSNGFFGKSLGIPVIAGIETSSPTIEALDAISRHEVGPSW